MPSEVSSSGPLSDDHRDRVLPRRLQNSVKGSIAAISFWGAIALPALYVPLLAVGINSVTELMMFLGLFCLHLTTLVFGHSYQTTSHSPE